MILPHQILCHECAATQRCWTWFQFYRTNQDTADTARFMNQVRTLVNSKCVSFQLVNRNENQLVALMHPGVAQPESHGHSVLPFCFTSGNISPGLTDIRCCPVDQWCCELCQLEMVQAKHENQKRDQGLKHFLLPQAGPSVNIDKLKCLHIEPLSPFLASNFPWCWPKDFFAFVQGVVSQGNGFIAVCIGIEMFATKEQTFPLMCWTLQNVSSWQRQRYFPLFWGNNTPLRIWIFIIHSNIVLRLLWGPNQKCWPHFCEWSWIVFLGKAERPPCTWNLFLIPLKSARKEWKCVFP